MGEEVNDKCRVEGEDGVGGVRDHELKYERDRHDVEVEREAVERGRDDEYYYYPPNRTHACLGERKVDELLLVERLIIRYVLSLSVLRFHHSPIMLRNFPVRYEPSMDATPLGRKTRPA